MCFILINGGTVPVWGEYLILSNPLKKKEKMEEFNPTNEPQEAVKNANVAPENFDWEAYEKGDDIKSNRQLDTELYDKTLSQIQNQEVVEGTVVSINKREVVVNIGYKSDGVIPYAEFR